MKLILWTILTWLITACVASTAAPPVPANLSTDTHSSNLLTEAQQIAFLQQYVTFKSPVEETEFYIVYHDNSGGLVPAPSDWDLRVVMRVADVTAWTAGKTLVDAADLSWADDLLTAQLHPTSQPTFYANATAQLAIFEPEKIVFLRSTTTPE